MNNFEELRKRGYIYQTNNEEKLKDALNNKKIKFYLGIDPTADSLHIGHLFSVTLARRLQQMGHTPIIIMGTGTTRVGDPSGRLVERPIMSSEEINNNKNNIIKTLDRFLDFEGSNKAVILYNDDWLGECKFLDFMRDIGIYFNVNEMLRTDSCRTRLEAGGLSFFEMSYSLLQAYDFYYLFKNHGVTLQIGGADQWSNLLAGINLIKKKESKDALALTSPLLVDANGLKMGKTAGNAIWIDKNKLSAYDFFQTLINLMDEDTKKMLNYFTDLSLEEIDSIMEKDIREAKKIMAYEVTKFIRGESDADIALKTSEEVFNKGVSSSMPTYKVSKDKINILDLLVESKLASSKSEGRRLIEQGGVKINDNKISDINYEVEIDDNTIIQKGKKKYLKITK